MSGQIQIRHLQVRRLPDHPAGFSERAARAHYQKRGFEVWRGRFLDEFFKAESPFTQYHYSKYFRAREHLARRVGPQKLIRLAKFCASHHGTPDFLVRHKAGLLRFVEAKLAHEALSPRQYRTCHYLLSLGLDVELLRVTQRPPRAAVTVLSPVGDRLPVVTLPRLTAYKRQEKSKGAQTI